jgi:hypothetical protein
MALLSTIKSTVTAAALALAVGAAGVAAPAQAAPSITLNFGSPGFGMTPGVQLHFGGPNYFKYCLNDNGIVDRLENRGYDNVHIIRHNHNDDYDNKVWVVAQNYKGDWYQMRVDRCTHKVDHIRLVHKHNNGNFDFNRFSFSFSF